MEQKIVTISMSFETQMGNESYMELMDIIRKDHIDNKKLIDFFALDKRPLILAEMSKVNDRPHGPKINTVEIKLIG